MRLATSYERILGAGAEIVALCVDPPERQAAFAQRWSLPFTFLSDPGGETYLRDLDLFDPEERSGIALAALVLVSPRGEEVLRMPSRDFADRVHDDDVLDALEVQGWPPVRDPGPQTFDVAPAPEPVKGAFSPEIYNPYFRGNYFGAIAIGGRLRDEADVAEAKAHRDMARSFTDAWKAWRERVGA